MEKALQLLRKDITRNCNIINFIEQYPIERIEIMGKSVMVRGRSDEIWNYISSENEGEFKKIIKKLQAVDMHFAVLEDWMLPYLTLDRTVVCQLTCIKLVYTHDVSLLPETKHSVIELRPEEAPYIYDNYGYQKYTSVEYIAERIRNGNAFGIYENRKLVAWIATHDDGAMGLLHVLPEFRRRGYGYDLIVTLIRCLYEQGNLPFVHIEEENEKSMNLALKVGFKKDRRIHWLKVK